MHLNHFLHNFNFLWFFHKLQKFDQYGSELMLSMFHNNFTDFRGNSIFKLKWTISVFKGWLPFKIPFVFADLLSKFTINFKSTYIDDFMFKNGFKCCIVAYLRVISSIKRKNASFKLILTWLSANRGVENPYLRI